MLNLILVLNHRCNFNCKYCRCKKDDVKISYKIAILAIDLFFKIYPYENRFLIKFCGGEPLLDFKLLKKIIKYTKSRVEYQNKKVNFHVSTNGSLLTTEKIVFFKKNKEIELVLSLDGTKKTYKKNRISQKGISAFDKIFKFRKKLIKYLNLSINMVVSPDSAHLFSKNFIYIHALGFKRINILPAYFMFWPKDRLRIIKKEFIKIAMFLKKIQKNSKEKFVILNKEASSSIPLINQGIVVDCNGDVFLSNVFLLDFVYDYRDRFKIGSILRGHFTKKIHYDDTEIRNLMKNRLKPEIYHSTFNVDKILTDFILKIKDDK